MSFFIAFLGTTVCVFLVPLYASYLVGPETRENLQELFRKQNIQSDILRPRRNIFRNLDFWKEYAIFYLPILSFVWCMPGLIYFQMPVEKILSLVITSSFIASALLLYIFKLKTRPKTDSFLALLWLNMLTISWILFVEIGVLKVWQYTTNESIVPIWKAVSEVISVSVLVTLCHMAMAWARFSIHRLAGAAFILFTGLDVYPGYSAIGASALEAAQLGGGTRISYTVVGPRATTSKPATGCLVLATSGYVLIGELDNNIYPSLKRFAFTASDVKPRPVHMFSRSE